MERERERKTKRKKERERERFGAGCSEPEACFKRGNKLTLTHNS